MRGKRDLQILNIIGFLAMVFVNFAANAIPLNNLSTGEVSELYTNLFTPAGITFSIWGLIYFLLLVFVIYQARDLFSPFKQEMPFLKDIGYLFFISSMLNAAWIFAWHYLQIFLSLLIIIALLAVLIKIYFNLDIGRGKASTNKAFLVNLPFQIYLGWITIASIANLNALLTHLGWNRLIFPEAFWTIVLIAIATVVTLAFLKLRQDIVIALVSLWALLGIVIKRLTIEPVIISVIISAILAMVIIAAFAINNVPESLRRTLNE